MNRKVKLATIASILASALIAVQSANAHLEPVKIKKNATGLLRLARTIVPAK
jgi:hypothetical protein